MQYSFAIHRLYCNIICNYARGDAGGVEGRGEAPEQHRWERRRGAGVFVDDADVLAADVGRQAARADESAALVNRAPVAARALGRGQRAELGLELGLGLCQRRARHARQDGALRARGRSGH